MIDTHRLLAGRVLVSNTPWSQRLYAHRSAVQHNDMAVQEAGSLNHLPSSRSKRSQARHMAGCEPSANLRA
jgi:hypothetical protein